MASGFFELCVPISSCMMMLYLGSFDYIVLHKCANHTLSHQYFIRCLLFLPIMQFPYSYQRNPILQYGNVLHVLESANSYRHILHFG